MKKVKSIFRRVLIFAFFLVILLANAQAQADIHPYIGLDARADFDAAFPGADVQDWDSYKPGTSFPNGTADSKGITYSSSFSEAMVTTAFIPSTEPNGLGLKDGGYFISIDTITFSFSVPIQIFGIDINTEATADKTFKATTSEGVAFSVFDHFPGYATGQFVGFYSDVPLSWVTIALTDPVSHPFTYTLDTMRYPIPSTLLLLGSGLAGLVLWGGRKRFKA